MANPHKGEVAFSALDATWTLSYSVNALCELEAAFGGPTELAKMLSDPSQVSVTKLRTMFRAGLSDHHDDVDDKQAGHIMTALGLPKAVELVSEALNLAFPTEEGAAANGTARPQTRRPAAGPNSSGRGSRPAAIPSSSGV